MELEKMIVLGIGAMVSVVAFYLKKESAKIEKISSKLRRIEVDLAKNDARDCERWSQIQKLLEDRRQDAIKLYNDINSK
jgi:hypothetical protein